MACHAALSSGPMKSAYSDFLANLAESAESRGPAFSSQAEYSLQPNHELGEPLSGAARRSVRPPTSCQFDG